VISADAVGGVQLFPSNAGNHDRSLVFCRADGRAANAANRARNQDRLASLDATRYGYELVPRDRDERECGCLDQINAIGDSRKNAGLNSTQLGVRMEGPCKHVITNGELVHFRTKANNGPGHIPTDDGRELEAQGRLCRTGPLPQSTGLIRAAAIRMRTSPVPGTGSGTSSYFKTSGPPYWCITTAFTTSLP